MLTKKQASQGVLWTRKEWRCPYIGRNKERRKEGEGVEAYDSNIERDMMMMML